MGDDRYYFQSRLVRLARWLRWRPYYFAYACFWAARWALGGCRPLVWPAHDDFPETRFTRRETAGHLWTMCMSQADVKMKRYRTVDEVLASWSAPAAPQEKEETL